MGLGMILLSISSEPDFVELDVLRRRLEALSVRVLGLKHRADVLDTRFKALSIMSDKLEARADASALILAHQHEADGPKDCSGERRKCIKSSICQHITLGGPIAYP